MNFLKTVYQRVTTALTPVGRVLYLPYSTLRVFLQWLHYITLLSCKYTVTTFNYYLNFLFMIPNPETKSLSSQLVFIQAKVHYDSINHSRPTWGDEANYLFDPPDSLFNIQSFLVKSWGRTDYYWDRYVIHTPFCFIGRFSGVRSHYVYVAPIDRSSYESATRTNHEEYNETQDFTTTFDNSRGLGENRYFEAPTPVPPESPTRLNLSVATTYLKLFLTRLSKMVSFYNSKASVSSFQEFNTPNEVGNQDLSNISDLPMIPINEQNKETILKESYSQPKVKVQLIDGDAFYNTPPHEEHPANDVSDFDESDLIKLSNGSEFEPKLFNLKPVTLDAELSPKNKIDKLDTDNSSTPVKRFNKESISPLKDLFKFPIKADTNAAPSVSVSVPVLDFSPRKAPQIKRKSSSSISESNVLYKIKIRKKPKVEDLSVHNYELVRQEILNTLNQPDFDDGSIGPNVVRFAWHCCATYDKNTKTGGSNGATMRFPPELTDPGNTGLHSAKSFLDLIKHKFEWITYADLYTLAGAVAIEAMGGPKIPWRPGRIDCADDSKVPKNGRLPIAVLGLDHIEEVFINRLGFNIRETVCLIGGGHGLGRCHPQYSGFDGKWTDNPIVFNNQMFQVLLKREWKSKVVPQTKRVQFEDEETHQLMMLNTDMALVEEDNEFKKWCIIYAENSDLFFQDFAVVFAKLLELGVFRDDDGVARTKY